MAVFMYLVAFLICGTEVVYNMYRLNEKVDTGNFNMIYMLKALSYTLIAFYFLYRACRVLGVA